MNTTHATTAPVRIAANYGVTKHLGNWTSAREFQVRACRGHAVLDLRSPHIEAGEIRIDVELDHAMLKLLVPDGAVIDDWDLQRLGRGRVKDAEGRTAAGASCLPGSCGTARSASTAAASPSFLPCSPASTWPTCGARTPRAGSRPWTTRPAPPDRASPPDHRAHGVCRHGGTLRARSTR